MQVFEFALGTLPKTYEARNKPIGPSKDVLSDQRDWDRLARKVAICAPVPQVGLRSPLWEGMEVDES